MDSPHGRPTWIIYGFTTIKPNVWILYNNAKILFYDNAKTPGWSGAGVGVGMLRGRGTTLPHSHLAT